MLSPANNSYSCLTISGPAFRVVRLICQTTFSFYCFLYVFWKNATKLWVLEIFSTEDRPKFLIEKDFTVEPHYIEHSTRNRFDIAGDRYTRTFFKANQKSKGNEKPFDIGEFVISRVRYSRARLHLLFWCRLLIPPGFFSSLLFALSFSAYFGPKLALKVFVVHVGLNWAGSLMYIVHKVQRRNG